MAKISHEDRINNHGDRWAFLPRLLKTQPGPALNYLLVLRYSTQCGAVAFRLDLALRDSISPAKFGSVLSTDAMTALTLHLVVRVDATTCIARHETGPSLTLRSQRVVVHKHVKTLWKHMNHMGVLGSYQINQSREFIECTKN